MVSTYLAIFKGFLFHKLVQSLLNPSQLLAFRKRNREQRTIALVPKTGTKEMWVSVHSSFGLSVV